MRKGTYLTLTTKSIQYLKFKAEVTEENMSSIVEDLIQRDITQNYDFYTRMESFFANSTKEE
jgi:hypothetical protein